MNKTDALALIQRQRQRWRSQEPDLAIARRAERVFFRVAVVYFCVAPLFVCLAAVQRHLIFYLAAAAWLFGGTFLLFQSRRFTQVLRVLSDEH